MEEYQNPEWAAPCARFIEHMLQSIRFVSMSQRGADVLVKLPRTIDSFMTGLDFSSLFREEEKSIREEQLHEIQSMGKLAESDLDYNVGDTVKIGDEVFARSFFGLLTYGVMRQHE